MWLMQLGEVVFGGVGSGLYGMLIFAIIAVFIAGLMVGRTPEYLGKKIEAYEMKMASLVILIPPLLVLVGTAIAVIDRRRHGRRSPTRARTGSARSCTPSRSAGNNNGSAFAGLSAQHAVLQHRAGHRDVVRRYWLIVPVLAIAGSLAARSTCRRRPGTLPTHTPLFVVAAGRHRAARRRADVHPALALGPIVEHLHARCRSEHHEHS